MEQDSGKVRNSLAGSTSPRRLAADIGGRWLVRIGGVLVIASILGILLFILLETSPLAVRTEVTAEAGYQAPGSRVLAVMANEYRSHVAVLDADGLVTFIETESGRALGGSSIFDEQPEMVVDARADGFMQSFIGKTASGRLFVAPVDFSYTFTDGQRVVSPELLPSTIVEMDPEGSGLGVFDTRVDETGGITACAQLADGRLLSVNIDVEENDFTGEVSRTVERHETGRLERLTALVLDTSLRNLYGAGPDGQLYWWTVSSGELTGKPVLQETGTGVSSLEILLGGRTVLVGRGDGSLSAWFQVRKEDGSFRLEKIRDFEAMPGSIRTMIPSPRFKGFAAIDSSGQLALYHSTAHRLLWSGESPLPSATSAYYTAKADSLFLASSEQIKELDLSTPHPEVSFGALLGKVWYEGYPEPGYVWQSSSATDDFEPKLSLIPLLIGSLKGTFYSLLLAIPLGVLGAMYTSQFMHPSLKRYVKPTVEIMAALPSVVLGFVAGLWLAPRIEEHFCAIQLMVLILPLCALAAGYSFNKLPASFRSRFPVGFETFAAMLFMAIGGWLAVVLAAPFEAIVFDGSFKAWLLDSLDTTYDQRNAVVVGIAMGFAVIPIIFSVAEDAFSNVPRNLVAGSLALGANRWETATRIVLPTASPGIFSAIMIGFGRAVGETMIVLMATGNTPIMDWSPFSGFRTLSANIAVEIPEAPHGGTLYRTLFLAALLLFLLTFIVNTLAEVVRQHLRNRYASL